MWKYTLRVADISQLYHRISLFEKLLVFCRAHWGDYLAPGETMKSQLPFTPHLLCIGPWTLHVSVAFHPRRLLRVQDGSWSSSHHVPGSRKE